MPAPNSAKEIKQFLGLTGYYRKFVPRFADISRPLTTLTKKDTKFKWTSACQKSFELLKEALCGEPVLKYADTSKPYTLYTDASRYGWAGILTQPHEMTANGKSTTTDHPVAFVSGLFRGSQLNWAALTKEAFAIYISVKKLSFYLTNAQILLRSDHKALEKFLLKNTLNSKVNNWAMELEAFNIQFDYINPFVTVKSNFKSPAGTKVFGLSTKWLISTPNVSLDLVHCEYVPQNLVGGVPIFSM